MQGCWGRAWGFVDELSKEAFAGPLEAAGAARVWNLSSAETSNAGPRGGRGAAGCRRI